MSIENSSSLSRTLAQGLLEQAILDLILAPGNRILILLQTQPQTNESVIDTHKEKGHLSYLTQIVKQESFTSLWKGNLIETLKSSLFKASSLLFLKLYEPLFLPENPTRNETSTILREFILLFAVECSALIVQHPLKVIRVKLAILDPIDQNSSKSKNSLVRVYECIEEIWRKEGFLGFYKGIGVSFMQSLSNIILLAVRKPLTRYLYPETTLESKKHKRKLFKDLMRIQSPTGMAWTFLNRSRTVTKARSSLEKSIFKLIYRGISALILYPYKVVQSRIIIKPNVSKNLIKGPEEIVKEIWDKEGFGGFYRGIYTNAVISLVSLTMYSTAKTIAGGLVERVMGVEENQVLISASKDSIEAEAQNEVNSKGKVKKRILKGIQKARDLNHEFRDKFK